MGERGQMTKERLSPDYIYRPHFTSPSDMGSSNDHKLPQDIGLHPSPKMLNIQIYFDKYQWVAYHVQFIKKIKIIQMCILLF